MIYTGNYRLGDLFESRREKGSIGLPLLSVTLTNGMVNRKELKRKQETEISDEEHLVVRKGDIAYNMMRMWQGASGLAAKDGIISPAYVVLAPKAEIDSEYASYLFKTKRLIYMFWAYSYGLTEDRLRLYYPDFAKIPVNIPRLEHQKTIARCLSTWDNAIVTTKKLIDNGMLYKQSLLLHLLSGKNRLSGFECNWKELKFRSIATLSKKKFDPTSSNEQCWCIELEHVEQRTGRICGHTETNAKSSTKSIFTTNNVLFGKLRSYLRKSWLADRDGVCSTEFWVLEANPKVCLPEYLFYLVQTEGFLHAASVSSGSKMPRAEWDVVSNTRFLIPSLNEQRKIIGALKAVDAELVARNQQELMLSHEKQALMQQLFTGKQSRLQNHSLTRPRSKVQP